MESSKLSGEGGGDTKVSDHCLGGGGQNGKKRYSIAVNNTFDKWEDGYSLTLIF